MAAALLAASCGGAAALPPDEWADAACKATLQLHRDVPWSEGVDTAAAVAGLSTYAEALGGLEPPPTASDELRSDFFTIRDLAASVTAPTTSTPGGSPVHPRPQTANGVLLEVGAAFNEFVDHYEGEIPALSPEYDPDHSADEPYDSSCQELANFRQNGIGTFEE